MLLEATRHIYLFWVLFVKFHRPDKGGISSYLIGQSANNDMHIINAFLTVKSSRLFLMIQYVPDDAK